MQLAVGEDLIHYAAACADKIPDLQMFTDYCKPMFLFFASGVLVAFIHGANSKKMRSKIEEEVNKEASVLKGEKERAIIDLEEAIPLSDLHLDADFDKLEEEDNLKNNGKSKTVSYKIERANILLVQKSILDESKKYDIMKDYLPGCGFQILDKKEIQLAKEDENHLEEVPNKVKDCFSGSKCGLLVVKYSEDKDAEEVQKAFEGFFSISADVPKGAKVKPLQKKLDLKDSIGFFCLDEAQSVYFVKRFFKLEFETGQYDQNK